MQAACTADRWDVQFINQSYKNPDTDVLDLAFSNSIQHLQDDTAPRMTDQLIPEVGGPSTVPLPRSSTGCG